jgi:hypothetical protein
MLYPGWQQTYFRRRIRGPLELLFTRYAAQQAVQLTDGPGDNTFGGFLSDDDRTLWYVKNNRQLRRVDLATREEQVVYTVDDDWVAYGTWVANSDCSKLVGIEIKKRLAAADRLE